MSFSKTETLAGLDADTLLDYDVQAPVSHLQFWSVFLVPVAAALGFLILAVVIIGVLIDHYA